MHLHERSVVVSKIHAQIDRARVKLPVRAFTFGSECLIIHVKSDLIRCFVEGHRIRGRQIRIVQSSYKQWVDLNT
jgi:hypothetical protein